MDDGRCIVNVGGETVHLLADRALWWPTRSMLFVADVHFGRIASYRARGAPVPGDTLGDMLDRLGRIIDRVSAQRLVVLGDLVQERAGLTDGVVQRVAEAMASWNVSIGLIPGNHERQTGSLPTSWPIEQMSPGVRMGPFGLYHHPRVEREAASHAGEGTSEVFELAGHYHPTARLEFGGDRLRLPCFALGQNGAILPAFHTMTNGVEMRSDTYRLFVIAEGEVISLQEE
jgi:DNA ligase-associated metallophosphoesterase